MEESSSMLLSLSQQKCGGKKHPPNKIKKNKENPSHIWKIRLMH
jgi:hypothetical protein